MNALSAKLIHRFSHMLETPRLSPTRPSFTSAAHPLDTLVLQPGIPRDQPRAHPQLSLSLAQSRSHPQLTLLPPLYSTQHLTPRTNTPNTHNKPTPPDTPHNNPHPHHHLGDHHKSPAAAVDKAHQAHIPVLVHIDPEEDSLEADILVQVADRSSCSAVGRSLGLDLDTVHTAAAVVIRRCSSLDSVLLLVGRCWAGRRGVRTFGSTFWG